MNLRCFFLISMLIASAFFSVGCTFDPVAGGSGSTTTNGFSASIRDSSGNGVAGAMVRVRPGDYCATGAQLLHDKTRRDMLDTMTGTDGSLVVGALEPGDYTIEIADTLLREGVLLRGRIAAGGMVSFGVRRTEMVGSLTGTIDPALAGIGGRLIVQIKGVERFASVDLKTGKYFVAALPPDTYSVRLASDDTAFEPVVLGTITIATGDTALVNPFDSWTRRATVTLDLAAGGVPAGEALFDFPLLLRFDTADFDFSAAKKKGEDLRITRSDGSIVRYEIDWWDSAGGRAAVWALLDTVRADRQSLSLDFYWGNRDAVSLSAPAVVFDSAKGYTGVWHLNESGGTVQMDATAYHNDGTPGGMDGGNDIVGIVGRSQRFDGDSTRVTVASSGVTGGGINNSASVSVWVRNTSSGDTVRSLLSSLLPGYDLLLDGKSRWIWPGSDANGAADTLVAPAAADTWALLTAVRRGPARYLYVNGTALDSGNASGTGQPLLADSGFVIGCRADGTGFFNGIVDEVRMHRTGLSAAWIRCCYETQREDQRVVSIRRIR